MEIKVNVAQGSFKSGLTYSTSGIKQTNKTYKQTKNHRRSKKTSLGHRGQSWLIGHGFLHPPL